MEAGSLFTYMAALAALTLTPGPLVAILAARSAGEDRQGAFAFAAGVCAGDVLVVLAVWVGLGLWLQAQPELFVAGKYAGAGFLLWMAWRMWRRPATAEDDPARVSGVAASLLAGFAICLGSPQTVVMYLVLVPRVADPATIGPADALLLIFATLLVLFGAFLTVIVLAKAARRLLASAVGLAIWSRLMALSVAVTALWVAVW